MELDLQSLLGYSKGSPYAGNPYLTISTPSGQIDMSNTPIDLIGIDNKGQKMYMKAGKKKPYQFKGNQVLEVPLLPPLEAKRGGNPYQRGGLTPKQLFDFIFDDDETEVKTQVPTAPSIDEVPSSSEPMMDSDETMQMAMDIVNADFYQRRGNPYRAPQSPKPEYAGEIKSSGIFGSQNVGEYGRAIYGELASDLGYSPVVNSIYRSKKQQEELIRKGKPAVRNSWHLTGNAIDLKPTDWEKLSPQKKQYYKTKYDVVYHDNHYHIEPK